LEPSQAAPGAAFGAFRSVEDVREPWRVAYPLREVLFLAVCATIANCDDYEDIVDWGEANLKFLRGFSDYHFGIPCADWLRSLMNRIDPSVFGRFPGLGRQLLAGPSGIGGD